MTQTPMYQAQADSPDYVVASPGIGSGDTTIPFNDLTGILAGPGLITLRFDDSDTTPETIYYPLGGVSGNSLVGVTRGFGGTTAKDFPAGSVGCRANTAYDHNTFLSNINDLVSLLSGKQATLTNPVTGSTSSFTSGDIITGTGTGNTVQDSGTLLSSLATKSQIPSAVSGDVITGTGTGIQDSGVLLSNLVLTSDTRLSVATAAHAGLLPILENTGTKYLRDDGTWQTVGGGSGTVTSVASGNGMNFTTITGTGTVTLGTPSSITSTSTNAVTTTSHTHAIDSTIFTASNGKSVTTPVMDGSATIGTSNTWADGAHIHPTDTSRLSATSSGSGYIWIGTSSNGFSNAQITQGTGITVTNASGSITIANPWGAAPVTPAQGMVLYYNGSAWVGLAAGTNGYFLQTQGAGADPQWAVGGGGSGTVTSVAAGNGMNFTTITGTGTVTMGTPSSITSTSTNATTTNSHTHAIDSTIFTASNGKSVTTPVVDGTATIGTTNTWADGGHIHPTDTSRAPTANPTFTGTVTIPAANDSLILSGTPPANGSLLIGDGTGFRNATITAGSNVTVTNGAGTITIASSGGGASLWTALGTPTYASSSTFTLSGDQTALLYPGRPLRYTISGVVYPGMVVSATYSSPNTTVTVRGWPLTNGLTAVDYGDNSRISKITFVIPGYYEPSATAATTLNDRVRLAGGYTWSGPSVYIVGLDLKHITNDGSTAPNVNGVVNGNLLSTSNSNAGPAMSSTSLISTGIDLNTTLANIKLAYQQVLEVKVTVNSAAAYQNATDLEITFIGVDIS